MGIGDKIGNAAEEATGKAKEAVGKATDDEADAGRGHGRPGESQCQAGWRKRSRTPWATSRDAIS
jgi:uncharacterized protein YjbJ (UPF0337 family)